MKWTSPEHEAAYKHYRTIFDEILQRHNAGLDPSPDGTATAAMEALRLRDDPERFERKLRDELRPISQLLGDLIARHTVPDPVPMTKKQAEALGIKTGKT